MTFTLRSAFVASVLAFAPAVFAGSAGNVYSANIREADGTTGQDTTRGSGVKTNHVQDGAVTNRKIADGAITDAKISGVISAAKLPATLNADTVDGKHAADLAPAAHSHPLEGVGGLTDALAGKADASHAHDGTYQKRYAFVIVVAKAGGDFTDPVAAVNSITDASETNRYLVKIMPGVYDVAPVTFFMKDYVDVEGSGRGVTVIRCQSWHMGHPIGAVYMMNVNHTELRDLTVHHTGGLPTGQTCGVSGSYVFGLSVDNGTGRARNVDLVVSNGSWTGGVYVGWANKGKIILEDVDVKATGLQPACVSDQTYGIELGSYSAGTGSEAELRNVKLDVSSGTYQGSLRVRPGDTAKGFGVQMTLPPYTSSGSGTIKCIACFDQNHDPLPAVLAP